eukprot:jgi/Mesen1/8578/ME000497S07977
MHATAVAGGERVPIPEIVAVGGQSDGKSSLLEALLGFRFNVREVEMGTRRPLVLQMVHDPTAHEPRCRLQDEDSDRYGDVIEPASAVADCIRDRTEAHLRALGSATAVSAKAIVLRAEYAFCPNLTIIDTPGFILKAKHGEPASTPADIAAMVKELMAPPNRIILFLQQSSVEWCSSLWLDSVRAVDPHLRRTLVVASKFDNRLKELAERWEVDRYMSASGYLGESARPFFVALPKDRTVSNSAEFRRQIAAVDEAVMRQLQDGIDGGFDETKYGAQVGFANLRRFLELELQKRYRDAAPATLALLERRCADVAADLARTTSKLAVADDVAALRRKAMLFAASVSHHVVSLLEGSSDPDPREWGRTSEEERSASGIATWPGAAHVGAIRPVNSSLRLYGGAAFERALDEFQRAACSVKCPLISREKVANIVLAHKSGRQSAGEAASEIARAFANAWLGPLVDALCGRLADIIRALFDIALARLREADTSRNDGPEEASLEPYVAFHASLRRAFDKFVDSLARACKEIGRHHLASATSPYSSLIGWEPDAHLSSTISDFEGPSEEELPLTTRHLLAKHASLKGRHLAAAQPPENDENTPPWGVRREKGGAHAHVGMDLTGTGSPLRESQLTVPETPSPDQNLGLSSSKRAEFGVASGRLSAMGHATKGGTPPGTFGSFEAPKPKQQQQQQQPQQARGASEEPTYEGVCAAVVERFRRIRSVVVLHLIPPAMSSGFLPPCREQLSTQTLVELFARSDADFMSSFIAPSVVESLKSAQEALEKRHATLEKCLREFQTISRSL